jgi:hypothetical protein
MSLLAGQIVALVSRRDLILLHLWQLALMILWLTGAAR